MKRFLFIVGLLLYHFSFSQKADENYSPAQYKNTTCTSSFTKVKSGENSAENIMHYLKTNLPNLKDERASLKLNYINQSPGGFHYSFSQTFNGVEIYQSEVKVNIDRQNTIHSVFDNSEDTKNWIIDVSKATLNSVIAAHSETRQPVLCNRRIENYTNEILETDNEIIFRRDMNSYYRPPDSLVSGKVFYPDPLTTTHAFYGDPMLDIHDSIIGFYKNNNDSDATWLDNVQQVVNFKTDFDGTQFLLQSPFVVVTDFDPPNIAPVTSATPQFYFNRSQSGFEDVNGFYHLSTIRNYVAGLGFNCADSLISIDTHALNGADNSFFAGTYSPHRVFYGTGGVNDAEDADVLVHEYSHSLSWTAAPNTNIGSQRNALDEGFADYMAASYSKSINTFNDEWMFNWDGHNEFWSGRIMNSTGIYPDDLNGNIYHDGEIWSAVLFSLNGDIGREATDSLILQTHYAYSQNISLQAAANLLIDADTILTNGKYFCAIYNRLFEHGLNPLDPGNQCTLGFADPSNFPVQLMNQPTSFTLINPQTLELKLEILTVQGQLIASLYEGHAVFCYENPNLSSGMYIVNIHTKNSSKAYKWVKM